MYTKSNVISNNITSDKKSQVKKNECLHILDLLDRLPKKPYCSNDLQSGLKIRPLAAALSHKYIQFNHLVVNYLIFDVDRPGAALAHEDANLPDPNLIIINKENQHAHLIYTLQKGISKFPDSSVKALKYLSAIEKAYTLKLAADFGYAGLIVKNPLNQFWQTWHIHNKQYELSELADYVDLPKVARQIENIITGVGRNVDIFENGRKWAYSAIKNYRNSKSFNDFYEAVFNYLNGLNSLFRVPLPTGEVVSTAKSISKWTWQHDKEAYNKFIERQKYKSNLGNTVKINKSIQKKAEAIELKNAGYSIARIAEKLGISRVQVYSYFNLT